MDGHCNKSGVACCFCNTNIDITDIDPCDINIMANWDKPNSKRRDQTFWCHFECFKSKMHADVKNYLILNILLDDEDEA